VVIRSKTKNLFEGKPLSSIQQQNSDMNLRELENGDTILQSKPRRIVLELTNACNLNCTMCGRNAVDFKLTQLDMASFYSLEPLFDVVEEVTLMGWGEPTIHPNFEEMLQVISKYAAGKYFCSNGMRLDKLKKTIFDCNVDVFAVSVDGATQKTNGAIRIGSDLDKINRDLAAIVSEKREKGLKYPHINYVFCAMKRNLHELSDVVSMAAEVGLEEVKVVFLTAFGEALENEVLYGAENEVARAFDAATKRAEESGLLLKLPYVCGSDPAGDALHRDCFTAYRDFYLGSDGYVRPCMSSSDKFFKYDPSRNFMDIWNAPEYQRYRKTVNSAKMPKQCRSCYQSSHCNWNNKKSYIQLGEEFAPAWKDDGHV